MEAGGSPTLLVEDDQKELSMHAQSASAPRLGEVMRQLFPAAGTYDASLL